MITTGSNRHNNNKYFFTMLCVGVSLCISITIIALPTVRDGLELLFLLPISFSIGLIIFGDVFSHWNDNVGTVVLFASCIMRYLLSPLLIALSGHTVAYIHADGSSYKWAIFVMIFELFSFLLIMKILWRSPRRRKAAHYYGDNLSENEFKITWIGWLFCALIVFVLITRGNLSNVFSHFSFWVNYSEDVSDVYTYDRTFVYLLKTIFFCYFVTLMQRLYNNKVKLRSICFIAAVLAAAINSIFYDHTSRSILVGIIVSSTVVLIYCFPRYKKFIILLFSICGFILVSSVFLFGTLQTAWSTIGNESNVFQRISEMAELYGNGVSTIAHSIETYPVVNQIVSIKTFFSGIVHSIGVITFPGLRSIYYAFESIPNAGAIFMETLHGRGFILPPFGLALYYGGIVFSVIISWVNTVVCVLIMRWISNLHQKSSLNAAKLYILTYSEIICGMSFFVNNISIMLQGLTSIPLLMILLLYINKLGERIVIKKRKRL